MPNPTRFCALFFLLFALVFPLSPLGADPEPAANLTPVATKAVKPFLQPKGQSYNKALIVHKPMPDPAWGKVVQYRWDQVTDPSSKAREIIYEFVFQDENGVVRVCKYHENDNGEGYWEVYLWDLP